MPDQRHFTRFRATKAHGFPLAAILHALTTFFIGFTHMIIKARTTKYGHPVSCIVAQSSELTPSHISQSGETDRYSHWDDDGPVRNFRTMFIVHVVRQFHPAVGGIENVVNELASAQVAGGHRVRIVTLNRLFKAVHRDILPAREMINGAEIIRVPFFGSPRYPLAPSAIKFIGDADVIHVHAIDFFFDYLAWTKPIHRRKLIVSTHGGFFHTRYAARLKQIYFNLFTRLSLTWYDAVVAVSVPDYEMFARLRRSGMVCIENGVDVAKYANAASQNTTKAIAWIGRFAAHKRLDQVLKFIAALGRYDREWTLKIAGRPWDLDVAELRALAQNEGVAAAVQVIPSPTEAEIRQMLGDCSLLVSSSDFEGFGIVAVEGLSAGLFP